MHEKIEVAKLCKEEGKWYLSSCLIDEGEEKHIGSEKYTPLEHAKEYIEDLIAEHFKSKIAYYQNLYNIFNNS